MCLLQVLLRWGCGCIHRQVDGPLPGSVTGPPNQAVGRVRPITRDRPRLYGNTPSEACRTRTLAGREGALSCYFFRFGRRRPVRPRQFNARSVAGCRRKPASEQRPQGRVNAGADRELVDPETAADFREKAAPSRPAQHPWPFTLKPGRTFATRYRPDCRVNATANRALVHPETRAHLCERTAPSPQAQRHPRPESRSP